MAGSIRGLPGTRVEVAGLDALETSLVQRESLARRAVGRDLAQGRRDRDRVRGLAAGRVAGDLAVLRAARADRRARAAGRGAPDARDVGRHRDHAASRGLRLRRGDRHRHHDRRPGQPVRGAPGRHRVADHGAPDHAVDRLVPPRDPAVQAHRGGDHLRGRAGRRPVDRQWPDPRHRPHPAGAPPGRAGAGRAGHRGVPARDPAGGDALASSRGSRTAGRSPGGR